MLSCTAFIALALTHPEFATIERGMTRLETGFLSSQSVNDTRTFLKRIGTDHYYWVESTFGAHKHFVEKVPQRGIEAEFCGIMDVDFEASAGTEWSFRGHLTPENGGLAITGLVDMSRSYFFNHVWVRVPELLELHVSALPALDLSQLDLSSVTFCEIGTEGFSAGCQESVDLSDLKN